LNWWNSIEDFSVTLLQSTLEPVFYMSSPDKRLYYLYILAAAALSFLVLITQQNSLKDISKAITRLFSRKILFHTSSLLDFKLIFLNSIFKGFFILPWIISSVTIATYTIKGLRFVFDTNFDFQVSGMVIAISFTITSFVISDFFRFYFHYLLHRIPFLWAVHKVHHSAEVMTPFTVHRSHPVEVLLGSFRNALSTGISSGLFIFLFKNQVTGFDILSVNALGFLFNILGSNLRHSHIRLSYGVLEYLFLSPAQHQIHHGQSPKLHHKNFGIALSIWDQILGTFHKEKKYNQIDFGLENEILNHKQRIKSSIIDPIVQGVLITIKQKG